MQAFRKIDLKKPPMWRVCKLQYQTVVHRTVKEHTSNIGKLYILGANILL